MVDHATVYWDNTFVGDAASYACDYGYSFHDGSKRRDVLCASTSKWTDIPVECEGQDYDTSLNTFSDISKNTEALLFIILFDCSCCLSPIISSLIHTKFNVDDGWNISDSNLPRRYIVFYWEGRNGYCVCAGSKTKLLLRGVETTL